jgi:uracil-DNA glycosylase
MSAEDFQDTVSSLARALAWRIRWETENSAAGYPKSAPSALHAGDTARVPSPSVASPVTQSTSPRFEAPPSPQLPTAEVEHAEQKTSPEDSAAALEALRNALGDCTRCDLHRGRTHLVFGEGNPNARLVFVGEGPGRDEDLAGRPFVGAAGQLLDRIIEAMGLTRDEVYICNVVKCRPPNNRVPEQSESTVCGPFVRRQIAVIHPEVIVTLGGTAAAYLLGENQPISRIRGRFHRMDDMLLMPTFHPAYLLRNPSGKRAVWNDMQLVMGKLGLERKKR